MESVEMSGQEDSMLSDLLYLHGSEWLCLHQALIALGIANRPAPRRPNFASFVFVAAIVEEVSGEVLALSPDTNPDHLLRYVWDELRVCKSRERLCVPGRTLDRMFFHWFQPRVCSDPLHRNMECANTTLFARAWVSCTARCGAHTVWYRFPHGAEELWAYRFFQRVDPETRRKIQSIANRIPRHLETVHQYLASRSQFDPRSVGL